MPILARLILVNFQFVKGRITRNAIEADELALPLINAFQAFLDMLVKQFSQLLE